MIIYDFEVFKHDWLVCWLDTETQKLYSIVNNKDKFRKFYEYYKNRIWVGYNSRQYDMWVAKAILSGFEPQEMNDWLIVRGEKGHNFSQLLRNYPILNYDAIVGFRGLKELEAFMGHDIRESSVPFNIDRKLTLKEIEEVIKYCKHDVMECFHVFVETKEEFESHIGLINEFNLGLHNITKTKAQLSAMILGATKVNRNDEFDIRLPNTLQLGKYEYIKDKYIEWSKNSRNYDEMKFKEIVAGVSHIYGGGGLHGAIDGYIGDGDFLMADVASYYPAMMIEYDFLSRNVRNKNDFKKIRDERIIMKANKDARQQPRKIVLNGTFGASKDQYNNLYDPQQANNICISGQLLLTDLIEKLEGKCQLIQSNTDGILVKLFKKEDRQAIVDICNEWSKRTRMDLEFEDYKRVIQKDVNNYIIVRDDGKIKTKGAFVKKLSTLDNDLPIVNKALVDYFVSNIPIETTILASDKLIDFQKVTKISGKYEFGFHVNNKGFDVYKVGDITYKGNYLNEKVHRCFASISSNDGTLYKKHKGKNTLDKTAGTPDKCFIINDNILDAPIPSKLDKQWYIDLAKERIEKFLKE